LLSLATYLDVVEVQLNEGPGWFAEHGVKSAPVDRCHWLSHFTGSTNAAQDLTAKLRMQAGVSRAEGQLRGSRAKVCPLHTKKHHKYSAVQYPHVVDRQRYTSLCETFLVSFVRATCSTSNLCICPTFPCSQLDAELCAWSVHVRLAPPSPRTASLDE
jgi:hypothetical protein